MTEELQRGRIFEPSGISGKLNTVLHDVSGRLITTGHNNAYIMER